MASLISSVVWVPRGASARHPQKYNITDPAEYARIEKLGKLKLLDAQRELEEFEKLQKGVDGMQVVNEGNNDNDDEDDAAWEDEDGEGDGKNEKKDSDAEDEDEEDEEEEEEVQLKSDTEADDEATGDDDMAKYNLDNYDQEVSQTASMGVFSNVKGLAYYANTSEEQDPYITLQNPNDEDESLEREELEILPTDNLVVSAKTADEVSLLEIHVFEGAYDDDAEQATTNDEDEDEANLYVHHDTLLPAMPLCLEWGSYRPSSSSQLASTSASATSDASAGAAADKTRGSFIAVGTFDKQIEIWDLDLIDGLFPEAILGDDDTIAEAERADEEARQQLLQQESTPAPAADEDASMAVDGAPGTATNGGSNKKKKKPKHKKLAALASSVPATSAYMHTDSVLSLAWNKSHRSLLASASADGTIKLWDLSDANCQKAIRSFDLFEGKKVQSIQWNPVEPTVLLAGAWEGELKIFDTRNPDAALSVTLPASSSARANNGKGAKVPDVEVVRWDPHSTTGAEFYVATSTGQVLYYDSRSLAKPLWTLDAHDGPCAALDVSPFLPGCFVTGGIDKIVKVWTAKTSGSGSEAGPGKGGISLVMSRDFGLGKIFSTLFSPDSPTYLSIAGSNATLNVFDLFSNAGFRRTFADRLAQTGIPAYSQERLQRRKIGGSGVVGVKGEMGEESDEE